MLGLFAGSSINGDKTARVIDKTAGPAVAHTGPRASNDDIGQISYRGASKEDAGPEFLSAHSLRLREIKQRLGC